MIFEPGVAGVIGCLILVAIIWGMLSLALGKPKLVKNDRNNRKDTRLLPTDRP